MERTYKKIEIVGSSEKSFGEATQNAVAKACQSLRHVDWFEVTEIAGWLKKTKSRNSRSPLRSFFGLKISGLKSDG